MEQKVRIDRRRDIALVFLLVGMGSALWTIHIAVVLLLLGVGIWRANEWARVSGGVVAALESIRLFWLLGSTLPHTDWKGDEAVMLPVVLFLALICAGSAFYLLRPSTRRRFFEVRGARSRRSQELRT